MMTLEEIDAYREKQGAILAEMEKTVRRMRLLLDYWDDPVEAIALGGELDLWDVKIAAMRQGIVPIRQ